MSETDGPFNGTSTSKPNNFEKWFLPLITPSVTPTVLDNKGVPGVGHPCQGMVRELSSTAVTCAIVDTLWVAEELSWRNELL